MIKLYLLIFIKVLLFNSISNFTRKDNCFLQISDNSSVDNSTLKVFDFNKFR